MARFTVLRFLTPDEADDGCHSDAYNEVREHTFAADTYGFRMLVEFFVDLPDWPTSDDLEKFVSPHWRLGARFILIDNTTGHSRTVDLTVSRTASLVDVPNQEA